jgi:hypothetical protein
VPTSATPTVPPNVLPTPVVSGLDADAAAQRAIEMLARKLQIEATALEVVNVNWIEWPTSALGCASLDQPAMQVIVPGYRIQLSDGNTLYNIHTSVAGFPMIWCDQGVPVDIGPSLP